MPFSRSFAVGFGSVSFVTAHPEKNNKLYFGIPHPKRATYTKQLTKKTHIQNVRNNDKLPKTKIGQSRPQVGAMNKKEESDQHDKLRKSSRSNIFSETSKQVSQNDPKSIKNGQTIHGKHFYNFAFKIRRTFSGPFFGQFSGSLFDDIVLDTVACFSGS